MQLLLGISLIAAVAGCEKDDNTSDDIEGGGGHDGPKNPVTYVITIENPSLQGVDVKIEPSEESTYYCGIHTEASLQGISDEALFKQLAELDNLSDRLHTGTETFTLSQTLDAGVSYVVLVAGYGNGAFTGDKAQSKAFTIAPESPASFNFELLETSYNSATFKITPLNPQMSYFAEVKRATDCEGKDDDQIITDILALYGSMASWFTVTGEQTFTKDDYGELLPDTDYYALIFGYDEETGGASTDLEKYKFRTAAPADPSTNTFKFDITDIEDRTATVTVTPSEPSVLYAWDLISEEEYKLYGGNAQGIEKFLSDYLEEQISEYLPTIEDVVTIVGVRGEKYNYYTSLIPETTYYVWAICIDASGNPLTTASLSDPFTTKAAQVSTATVEIVFDKYYDGSELYAIDADKYANYNGKAYIPATITPSEDALSWYTLYTDNDITNTSDDILISNLVYQGTFGGFSRNYGAEWDKPYSFCAVAADANGIYGPVFRKTVTFTRSGASPVSELQLTGATTAKAAPMIRLSSVGRFGVKTR